MQLSSNSIKASSFTSGVDCVYTCISVYALDLLNIVGKEKLAEYLKITPSDAKNIIDSFLGKNLYNIDAYNLLPIIFFDKNKKCCIRWAEL